MPKTKLQKKLSAPPKKRSARSKLSAKKRQMKGKAFQSKVKHHFDIADDSGDLTKKYHLPKDCVKILGRTKFSKVIHSLCVFVFFRPHITFPPPPTLLTIYAFSISTESFVSSTILISRKAPPVTTPFAPGRNCSMLSGKAPNSDSINTTKTGTSCTHMLSPSSKQQI